MIYCKKFRNYRKNRHKRKSRELKSKTSSLISILTNLWIWKKKFSVFSVLYLISMLSNNFGVTSRDQVRNSQQEIHNLRKKVQELPELNSVIEAQLLKIEEMENQIEQTIKLNEQIEDFKRQVRKFFKC
jgi:septal ring factor EnvC (AmiA/AmiB activator)